MTSPRLALALLVGLLALAPATASAVPPAPAVVIAEAEKLDAEADRLYHADKLDQALAVAERQLAITEEGLGPADLHTATARSNVGGLLLAKGDYLKAEPLLREGLEVFDRTPGAPARDHVAALNNLAVLYKARGRWDEARPLRERAVAILEAARPPLPQTLASSYRELAGMIVSPDQALALLDKAIALQEKNGPEGELARSLLLKGEMFRRLARPGTEALFARALELAERALGPESSTAAVARRTIGRLFRGAGTAGFVQGDRFYQAAYDTLVKTVGPMHPELAGVMGDWAILKQLQGDLASAIDLRRRADAIDERYLGLLLSSGSEEDKLAYSAKVFHRTEEAVQLSLTLGLRSEEARKLAFSMVLRRKGRVLDALLDERLSLQRHARPQDQPILARLARAQSDLAAAVLRGPRGDRAGYPATLALLEKQERQAEADAAALSASYRGALHAPTLEDIAKAIPEGGVLVEIAHLKPFATSARADVAMPEQYVTFVLLRDGTLYELMMHDASTVDALTRQLRIALASPEGHHVRELGQRLYFATLAGLENVLRPFHDVFVAPDGALNLIPFAALVDARGDWLIRRHSFTYLASGRDLLRFSSHSPSAGGPVVVANPSFDQVGATAPAASSARPGARGLSASDLSRMRFPPLPGTQREADAIQAILPGATVLTGDHATKAALRGLRAPSVLHIATHGFAIPGDAASSVSGSRGLELEDPAPARGGGAAYIDPRLLSGIALAGANLRRGADDGVLSALEAEGLTLDGTRLVVLSACETGVGDLVHGEGVYSLRRSFAQAGAETQVMSLWQVDDAATTGLMTGYYLKLFRDGKGRGEALREQQLAMLDDPATAHPFYWASFTVAGNPSPIGAATGLPPPPRATPSARGCACDLTAGSEGAPSLGAALLLALGLRRRRVGRDAPSRTSRPRSVS